MEEKKKEGWDADESESESERDGGNGGWDGGKKTHKLTFAPSTHSALLPTGQQHNVLFHG